MGILKVTYCIPIDPFASFSIKEEEINLKGSTLKDLIDELKGRHGKKFENFVLNPKTGALEDYVMMFINGVHVKALGGLKAKIKDGDYILLLPPIGGG